MSTGAIIAIVILAIILMGFLFAWHATSTAGNVFSSFGDSIGNIFR